jgi:hypothetical protein
MAHFIREEGVQVAFGGRIFNQITELRERIPAHFLGVTIEAAIETAESLTSQIVIPPEERPLSPREQSLAEKFDTNRLEVENHVVMLLRDQKREFDNLSAANHFLGNTLSAALWLGSPSYMKTDMDWLRNLLSPREVPVAILPQYLEIYETALAEIMGSDSQAIIQWIQLYRQTISTSTGI